MTVYNITPEIAGHNYKLQALGCDSSLLLYSDQLKIEIKRKGCRNRKCDEPLITYEGVLDSDSVKFTWDEEFYQLCRGRYEGTIFIGCEELPCKMDYFIGHDICVGDVTPIKFNKNSKCKPDLKDLDNPNCCQECGETEKKCGCKDITDVESKIIHTKPRKYIFFDENGNQLDIPNIEVSDPCTEIQEAECDCGININQCNTHREYTFNNCD